MSHRLNVPIGPKWRARSKDAKAKLNKGTEIPRERSAQHKLGRNVCRIKGS
jgi:hypothetical protein